MNDEQRKEMAKNVAALVGTYDPCHPERDFSILQGMTLTNIEIGEYMTDLTFTTSEGRRFRMCHHSECCEQVSIEDINGDIADLIDTPILLAEKATNDKPPEGYPEEKVSGFDDCYLWTFYKLRTIKGSVDIRWFGQSNGYYSVGVDFDELEPTAKVFEFQGYKPKG